MSGYTLLPLPIDDPAVVAISGRATHTMASFTGREADAVPGTVFELSAAEIACADRYEVAAVTRVAVLLRSGRTAWAYVDAAKAPPRA